MKIKTIKAHPMAERISSWNDARKDTYQVVDDCERVLGNFDHWIDADKFIKDNSDSCSPRERAYGF